jgi:hypothetical protein
VPGTSSGSTLAPALAERRSGQTISGGSRILHHRLSSNGWWSVIEGPADAFVR